MADKPDPEKSQDAGNYLRRRNVIRQGAVGPSGANTRTWQAFSKCAPSQRHGEDSKMPHLSLPHGTSRRELLRSTTLPSPPLIIIAVCRTRETLASNGWAGGARNDKINRRIPSSLPHARRLHSPLKKREPRHRQCPPVPFALPLCHLQRQSIDWIAPKEKINDWGEHANNSGGRVNRNHLEHGVLDGGEGARAWADSLGLGRASVALAEDGAGGDDHHVASAAKYQSRTEQKGNRSLCCTRRRRES